MNLLSIVFAIAPSGVNARAWRGSRSMSVSSFLCRPDTGPWPKLAGTCQMRDIHWAAKQLTPFFIILMVTRRDYWKSHGLARIKARKAAGGCDSMF